MKIDLNKIIQSFNSLNDQARYGILAGIVILVLSLDMFFLVLPQLAGISDANDRIKKISDDTQEVLTGRQRIVQLKKNLEDVRTQLNSLNKKVRNIQEVPVILSTISSIANDYGVKIDQLIPEKNLQEDLKAIGDGRYYALPIEIKARCGYHMFGRFLNKLESEDMYFILKNFIVENVDRNINTHSFSLTIKMILVDRR